MKIRLILFFLLAVCQTGALQAADATAAAVSAKIDALVEAGYKKHNVRPNSPASDEVFARRIYLDVIGRIPTQDELRDFLNAKEPDKRARLIDKLLNSEGYVSHWYNWWADILRLQTNMRDESGVAYAEWIKQALRENRPYDKMVYQMITAEGFIWENGAVGYYIRDAGMPLDNMSNTTQIFLGTRLVCAQCHNHPFDRWTQKDYYQMAAYTFGVDTEINPRSLYRRLADEDLQKSGRRMDPRERQSLRRVIDEILEPLKYGVQDSGRMLRFPDDYKYDDAKPGEYVKARTIFGGRAKASRNPRTHYAEWLTAPENPRFATVIANRLWKRAMGMGLIEPVDDFKDDTAASNPVLMKYLSDQMVAMGFDMKRMLRAIYNTKTYQREATREEVSPEQPYHFPGPLLRRMTAEQIWDSICALVIPSPEERVRDQGYKAKLAAMKNEAEALKACSPQTIVNKAKKYAALDVELEAKIRATRDRLNKMREDGDDAGAERVQKELNKLNEERDALPEKARAELLEEQAAKTRGSLVTTVPPKAPVMTPNDPNMMMTSGGAMKSDKPAEDRWKDYGREFFRASELPSPAPSGHFLREFGQSNREVIENSSTEASVSQALSLMNGPLFQKLTAENTVIMQRFRGAGANDEWRMNAFFQSLFARLPSEEEKALVMETVAERKREGWMDVLWALLNSREFIFIQ